MPITRAARVLAILAASAVAGFGAAAPAAADPPGHVRAAITTPANSFPKTLTVTCPLGTVVTGGGAHLTAPSAAVQGYIAIERLEPRDDGKGFTATMIEAQMTANAWRMTVATLCATPPAGWDVVAVTGPLGGSVVTVDCGTKNVIGMGGRINNGGGDVVLDKVAPSTNLKSVTARGSVIPGRHPGEWSVTAFAVCADVTAQLIQWPAPVGPAATKSATVTCEAGQALYSAGGEVAPGSGSVYLDMAQASDVNTAVARGNKAFGAAPPPWGLMVYGICG
ncbi:MAG: hypothetical protein HOY78_20835 [Saccharothrix sp.]|nr:hypothetical protein [Saccharothrix sp.]